MVRFLAFGLLAGSLLSATGCLSQCKRPVGNRPCPPQDAVFVPPPAPTPLQPSVRVQPNASYLPPGAVLTPPAGATIVQPGQQPPAFSNPAQTQQPPSFTNPAQTQQPPTFTNPTPMQPQTQTQTQARVESQWQPTEAREPAPPRVDSTRDVPPRINLYAPEPVDKTPAKDSYYLGPPQIDTDRKPTAEPAQKQPNVSAQANFPAIPQFAVVKNNVYAGLRPPLDGLDWLQGNGVQTVVQVRLPGEDDGADRKQVEKRNLRYVPFEVSPQTLTRQKADEFIRLIRSNEGQGVFVYDQDGSLAGAMWYLYMRLGENYDDDASQLRARPLGLQLNGDMWLAVQRVLSEK